MTPYRPRILDSLLDDLLAEFPAIFIVGARAVGKTTTALRRAASTLRLDQPFEAAVVRADPDSVLRDLPEPVLIDEWQVVPEVLGAVKRAVDADSRPGRFVITGSTRSRHAPVTWPGTGRLINVTMFGMTIRELDERTVGTPFLDRVVAGELSHVLGGPDLRDYVDLALRSGFPDAASASDAGRQRWLASYVEQVVAQDATELSHRDPDLLRRYLEAYALNSAGLATDRTIHEAAGISKRSGETYERLLRDLLMVDPIPAWTSNRLKRLTLGRKRYVADAALLAALADVGADTIIRDGDLLGRVIDTFVVGQLRPEVALALPRPRLHHLRTHNGRQEIDLVIEVGGGRIVAIEVKAGAAKRDDARHLAWLRDRLGDRFLAGVVLHTGQHVYSLGDRITAAPIASIWS